MNEKGKELVESFTLDHTKVRAPFVRECSVYKGDKGDVVTKYDIRFKQPNADELMSEGIHTLEHIMATYMREYMDGIIDLSPMGCRTGFYLLVRNADNAKILEITKKILADIIAYEGEVFGASRKECGNYLDLDLEKAKEECRRYLKALEAEQTFEYRK